MILFSADKSTKKQWLIIKRQLLILIDSSSVSSISSWFSEPNPNPLQEGELVSIRNSISYRRKFFSYWLTNLAFYHLMIVNQVNQVLKTNLSSEQLELIETNKITFMLMISALGKFFSITALDRDKCNIGISRALLYKCKAEFGTMLDDFF